MDFLGLLKEEIILDLFYNAYDDGEYIGYLTSYDL
jgi:hypothetical protein